jgi:hypothetical protein
VIADASRKQFTLGYPHFLSDGRRFLLMIEGGPGVGGAYVDALDSNPALRKRLLPDYTNAAYAPPGYLLFLRNGTLMAQVFDSNRTEISGEPLPVVEGLAGGITYFDIGDFSASGNGVLAYRRNQVFPVTQLVWFDRVGKRLGVVGPPGRYRGPWLAPDDKKVAVERVDQTGDIWVVDLGRAAWSRLTFDPDWDFMPVWSPDGSRIVFSAYRLNEGVGYTLHQKAATGTGAEETLFKSPGFRAVTDWSRDGRFILYDGEEDKTKVDVWILPLGGDRKPIPFLQVSRSR